MNLNSVELARIIRNVLREILRPDEFDSVQLTVPNPPTEKFADIVVLGEVTHIWLSNDGDSTKFATRVRDEIHDFIAESEFGWGEDR